MTIKEHWDNAKRFLANLLGYAMAGFLGLIVLSGIFGLPIVGIVSLIHEKLQPKKVEEPPDPYAAARSIRFKSMSKDQSASIVAVKYGLSAETIKKVISDYNLAYLSFGNKPFLFPEATNTEQVISALSFKYNIEPKTIASILIDESSLNKCPDPYEGPEVTDYEY